MVLATNREAIINIRRGWRTKDGRAVVRDSGDIVDRLINCARHFGCTSTEGYLKSILSDCDFFDVVIMDDVTQFAILRFKNVPKILNIKIYGHDVWLEIGGTKAWTVFKGGKESPFGSTSSIAFRLYRDQ